MKPKAIFTIIFSFFALLCTSQTIEETYRFAEEQFQKGNYQSALTEFQRVAFFDSEHQFGNIYRKIGDLFYASGDYNSAAKNFDIASRIETSDSIKTEILLKKVLCFFAQENYYFALSELLSITSFQNSRLANKTGLYTGIAFFGIEDYNQALASLSPIFPQEALPELEQIFSRFEKMRKRYRPGKIEMMSILLPGLGQIYCGNLASGINSMVLVGGIAVVAVWTWHTYGLLDALLSVSPWYYRYYTGGVQNARGAALERISHEREEAYQKIIELVETNLIQRP
ncbi:hypothetical protein SAMN05444274_10662 [Mariniphaga anaerophila]|uniref:Uncharacterized protein n=1 Tax=Mariniphaga anaerophila TaxID=1484053 RepID=A0A1M5CCW8_9BACT|nr:hypothetical protein [Mariniphaga anaerophila]SHF52565.1 hypothetical protein SAMN05444274_10662 [Mariniphaga anaerophila]